jgi:hypothetical protein
MSPQLQQVLAEIDRLSSIEQIQVIEYINTRQRSSVLETITNLRSQQSSFTLTIAPVSSNPSAIMTRSPFVRAIGKKGLNPSSPISGFTEVTGNLIG